MLGRDHLVEHAVSRARFGACELVFEPRDQVVLQLAGLLVRALAHRLFDRQAGLVELFAEFRRIGEHRLLRAPSPGQLGRARLELGELVLQLYQTLLRRLVRLFLERFAFDLELDNAAVELVDLLRLGIHFHAQPACRFVDEIDGLVGQESVGDVAVRERRRRDQRRIGDAHAVVELVFLLDPAQDRDRILDARLGDEHGLEPARQRRVLFDAGAILVQRRRADAVQIAARERRLEQVRGVDRALGGTSADQGVHLVDEQNDLTLRGRDFAQHRFQAFLEIATELGSRHQGAEVENHELFVLEGLGHVAVDDPLGEALDDRGLADAGLADKDGVVLGPP